MAARVELKQGTLEGKQCFTYHGLTYYSFEGIPYAKPPVGELRFKDPQPPENWTGKRDATRPGQKCAQVNPFSQKPADGAEDCLYLNVYTPVLTKEKARNLPVLFFVHGGSLLFGSGNNFRPDYLIQHDVILVTINYRLHILGFLCLNTVEVPGNAGVKDMIMALKWVKNNISKFNGDANNVTLMGESAGGYIASSLLATNMADDLFHKIIFQSSSYLSDLLMDNDDPVSKAKHAVAFLGKKIYNKNRLYEYLMNLSTDELVFAVKAIEMSRSWTMVDPYFKATVEKRFKNTEPCFTEHFAVTMRENRFKKMPLLLGVQSHEGAAFLKKDKAGNILYEKDFREFVPRFLLLPKESAETAKIVDTLKKFYFHGSEVNDNTIAQYIDLLGDTNFIRDVFLTADVLSKHCEVFVYDFHYNGNLSTDITKKLKIQGATHGDMWRYLFYSENKAKSCTDDDMKIVQFMTESWTNFAKNGNPSTRSCHWQPYTQETKLCLTIDKERKQDQYSKWRNVEMWRGIMQRYPSYKTPFGHDFHDATKKLLLFGRATSMLKKILPI